MITRTPFAELTYSIASKTSSVDGLANIFQKLAIIKILHDHKRLQIASNYKQNLHAIQIKTTKLYSWFMSGSSTTD